MYSTCSIKLGYTKDSRTFSTSSRKVVERMCRRLEAQRDVLCEWLDLLTVSVEMIEKSVLGLLGASLRSSGTKKNVVALEVNINIDG